MINAVEQRHWDKETLGLVFGVRKQPQRLPLGSPNMFESENDHMGRAFAPVQLGKNYAQTRGATNSLLAAAYSLLTDISLPQSK